MLVDRIEQATICNGSTGARGSNGTDGTNGTAGHDGVDGTNGRNGQDAVVPGLVRETVFCSAVSTAPDPFRNITYKHTRLYDGSLFIAVTCDSATDQDSGSDLFSSAQVGASSGFMSCTLMDETNAVIVISFTPNFLTRHLQVTENSVVKLDDAFDTDCTVVTTP